MALLTDLDPNIIFCGLATSLVPGIHDTTWLNKQNLCFMFRIRLVFDALWNHVHFTFGQLNMTVSEINSETAFQDYKGFIRVFVIMPHKLALNFNDLELIVIHFGDDLR